MRPALAAPLLLAACVRLPVTDDATFVDPCPAGLVTAQTAFVAVGDFRVGGILAAIDHDPFATWDDQPAACVGRNGKSAEIVLTYDGTPVGTLHAEVPAEETYELVTGGPGSVSLNLRGAPLDPPIVVGTSGWLSGLLIGETVGDTLLFYVENGEGISQAGEELYFNLEVELTVPSEAVDTGGGGGGDTGA